MSDIIKVEEEVAVETPTVIFKSDESKTFNEQAKEMVGALATKEAIEDESLRKDITETKKKELKSSAEKELKKEQENLQEAEYGVYKGIASYAGVKKPLPQRYQKILFTLYMILLFPFQLLVGTVFCVVNFFADCVDNFITKLGSIAKNAKILVLSVLALGGVALTVYIIVTLLQKYNIISF
jgi:hypothetical protein